MGPFFVCPPGLADRGLWVELRPFVALPSFNPVPTGEVSDGWERRVQSLIISQLRCR